MSVLEKINYLEQNKISNLNCSQNSRLAYLSITSNIKQGNMTSDTLSSALSQLSISDIDSSTRFDIESELRLALNDYEREKKQFNERVKRNIDDFLAINSKFRNLKFQDLQKIDKKFLDYSQKYCTEFNSRFKPFGVHLIFSGTRGIGKTSLAVAICLNLIESFGIKCSFVNLSHFISDMQNFDTKNESLDSIFSSDLVLIDDYGLTRKSDYAVEQVYMLIDELYRRNIPIIVTTNLTKSKLMNDNTNFSAITSRVLDNSIFVEMQGCDIRKRRVYDPEKVFGC